MTGRRRVRRGVLPVESEAAFQQKVVNLARFCGWLVYHPPDNRPSGRTGRVQDVVAGFPDLTMVRGPRLVFAELKAEKGRVAPAQVEWCDAIAGVAAAIAAEVSPMRIGVEVYTWRPSHWSEIEEVLKR